MFTAIPTSSRCGRRLDAAAGAVFTRAIERVFEKSELLMMLEVLLWQWR